MFACVLRGLAAAAVGVTLSSAASAATFYNGDFELDGPSGNGIAAGWSVVNGVTTTRSNALLCGPNRFDSSPISGCSHTLNGVGDLRETGIKQLVSGFEIGKSYEIAIDVRNYGPVHGDPDGQDIGIFAMLGGGMSSSTSSSNALGIGGSASKIGTLIHSFIADVADIEIQFLAQLSTDRSFIIDNAVIREAGTRSVSAVPLPASGFLLLFGLGALGIARRRKAI